MLLTSPRAKFERARVHKQAFFDSALAWLQQYSTRPTPVAKRVENDANNVETLTWSVVAADLAPDLNVALTLGDALNAYRAALDHVAWMAAKPTRAQRGDVYFPIVNYKSNWEKDFAKKMPGAPEEVRALIRNHQPFLNGVHWADHPLSLLSKWNNQDKHRVLHVIAAGTQHLTFERLGDWENFEVLHSEHAPLRLDMPPGTDVVRIIGRRRDPSKDHGVMYMVTGQLTVMNESGQVLEFALQRIDQAVDSVLNDFERMR